MRSFLPLVLIVAFGIAPASAQDDDRYSLVMRGVPLSHALEQLAYTTGIDLIYTSDDVEGKRSYCNGRNLPAAELLSCLLKGSELDFVRSSSGAYVLIDAVAAAPRFGHLAGTIRDAETGEPLPYANVLLADAQTGTSTNNSGLFSFASLLTGPHRVVVTYVGYQTARDSVWIDPGEHQRVQITLKPVPATLEPVVVNGLTQRLPSRGLGIGHQTSEHLRSTGPAATSDITRGLTAISGVAVHQPLADLHIQGSAAGEHVTLLDGVPVRDPVSMGRYLGAFSPLALGRVTVHKAGFAAEAGSNLAGVVEVEHDVSAGGGKRIVLSVDPLTLNGRGEAQFRLPGGTEGTAMAAGRTSVWGAYRDPAVSSLLKSWNALDAVTASLWAGDYLRSGEGTLARHGSDVDFSDLHSAVRLRLSPYRTLYASAYRARSHLKSNHAASYSHAEGIDDLMLTSDVYDWTNWVGQVRHSWLLGSRGAMSTQLSGSWNDAEYVYYGLYTETQPLRTADDLQTAENARIDELLSQPASDNRNHIRELSWHSRFSYSLAPEHLVDVGLSSSHVKSRFAFGNPFVTPFTHTAAASQFSMNVEGRHHLGIGTVLEPGLRLTHLPNRASVYAEPRLAVRHDRSAGRLGSLAFRVAGGVYRQFINQFEVTSVGATTLVPTTTVWLPADGSIAPPRAYHLAAEVLMMPNRQWTVATEVFGKWQHRLLMIDYAALASRQTSSESLRHAESVSQSAFVAPSSGRVGGGSIRIQRDGRRLRPTMTYSYVHAQRRYPSRFGDDMQPVPWNAPHRISADLKAELITNLQVLGNWNASWGRKWALRRAYYDYLAFHLPSDKFEPFDVHDPSAPKSAPYFTLDAGLSYQARWNPVTAEFRAFVTNVMNRRNEFDLSLEHAPDGLAPVVRRLPGRHIFLSVHFTY